MGLGIFLFLKQIADMFYQWQILDYGMVVFAVVLLGFCLVQDKTYLKIKSNIKLADVLIVGLAVIYFWSFLRDTRGYASFFKIESAFLLYFLGRVYGKKVIDHGYMLAIAGYIVIYLNLIVRFIHWGYKLLGTNKNDGGMYYYKTDLAVAVILATIFVYFFGKNKYLKWITIVPVTAYMVFYSGARMEWPILVAVYITIFIFELKKKKNNTNINKKFYKIIEILFIALVAVVIVGIQFIDFEKYADYIHSTDEGNDLIEKLCHSRQIYFWDIMYYFREQSFIQRLIGFDLTTISEHNIRHDRSHMEYVENLYATGYLGTLAFTSFFAIIINKISNVAKTKTRGIALLLTLFFLISGLTIENLELTQMSWFVFLFAGVTISEESEKLKA